MEFIFAARLKFVLHVTRVSSSRPEPRPPPYTEPCAASSRMKNPSPVLIIGRLRGVRIVRRGLCKYMQYVKPRHWRRVHRGLGSQPQRR